MTAPPSAKRSAPVVTTPPSPAMSEAEIATFKEYLSAATNYFEFGAGGSTVLASSYQNLKRVISVESDPSWIQKISAFVNPIRCKLVHGDIGPVKEWGHPVNLLEQESSLSNYWMELPRQIESEKVVPDLILIDGRFRVMCCLTAFKYAPEAIICIHDFTIRPVYHEVLRFYYILRTVGTFVFLKGKTDIDMRELAEVEKRYMVDSS